MFLIGIGRPPPLFSWRSSRTATNGVISGLVLFVSLVYWIVAMLTLLLRRKIISLVISPLIPYAFHCFSCRQLVGVGVESYVVLLSYEFIHVVDRLVL